MEIQYTSEFAAEVYGRDSNYGSLDAAGFDLRAMIDNPVTILPSEQVLIGTGLMINLGSMTIPKGFNKYAAIALPRSGRGSKEGLVISNTVGLIDQDYLGEIMLSCWARPTSGHVSIPNARMGGTPIHIEPYERIAQLVIIPVLRPAIKVVDKFSNETARGQNGFGSSGK